MPDGGAPPVTARTVNGLSAIDAGAWDALVSSGDGLLSHGYLSAWESCDLAGLRSCPTIAHQEGLTAPVAACPGYFYRLDVIAARLPAASAVMAHVRRVWPDLLYPLTYELGSPAPLSNPFLAADPGLRAAAVRKLITAAVQEGRREGAELLLVQNFTSLRGPAADELRRLGFSGLPILPTVVVDVSCFDSFEQYLSAMRAQYRRRARQALKRSEGLVIEHVVDFGELADNLARLSRLMFDRAKELKREILTPAFFRAVARLDDTSVLLFRGADGSIIAFALLLAEPPWLSFLQCGFDREAAVSTGVYFRLLYEIVRFGITGGFRQVELGVTTITPKLDIGGVPVPLFAWVKHRNPLIQRLLDILAKGPLRSREIEPRRVFKEPPPRPAELVAQRALSG